MVTWLVEMLTTRPKPWATMDGTQARAIRKAPTTLASTMLRKPCGSACQKSAGSRLKVSLISRMPRPALLISPSMRPNWRMQVAATAWQSSHRATSARTATATGALRPRFQASQARVSSSPARAPVTTTRCPA